MVPFMQKVYCVIFWIQPYSSLLNNRIYTVLSKEKKVALHRLHSLISLYILINFKVCKHISIHVLLFRHVLLKMFIYKCTFLCINMCNLAKNRYKSFSCMEADMTVAHWHHCAPSLDQITEVNKSRRQWFYSGVVWLLYIFFWAIFLFNTIHLFLQEFPPYTIIRYYTAVRKWCVHVLHDSGKAILEVYSN